MEVLAGDDNMITELVIKGRKAVSIESKPGL
jgi:hypothetical protein